MDNTQHDTLYTNIRRNTRHPAECSEKSYLCRETQEASLRRTGENVASRAKRYPLCFSGNFRRRENCPLLVRGSAPKTPLNAQRPHGLRILHPAASGRAHPLRRLSFPQKATAFRGPPFARLRVSAKRFRSMAVTGDHAPVSFPRCAHPCPAYDPRSACGAAARASRHGRCGIRHTPPFFRQAAWRIPPASS